MKIINRPTNNEYKKLQLLISERRVENAYKYIEVARAEVKKVEKLHPLLDQEEIVARIYLAVRGSVKGASLLIFPSSF